MPRLNQQDNCTRRCMSIFHSNICSIRKNLNQLLAFIAQQPQHPDVIAVTEPWLKRNENIVIPDYTMLSQPRDSRSRGGGVILFVKNEHSYTILPSLSCSTRAIESLFIRLESSVTVGVVYRPPNACFLSFLETLKMILSQLTNNVKQSAVIVGDMNIYTYSPVNDDYIYLLKSYHFCNLITTPTRITATSATLIDHALTNYEKYISAGVYDKPITDHFPIFVSVDCLKNKKRDGPRFLTKIDYLL